MVTKLQTAKTQESRKHDVSDPETAKYVEIFGKTYFRALALANETIGEVVRADEIITKAKGGTARLMLDFARECVKLTMDGDKADLPKAAELLRTVCAQAEVQIIKADAKKHGWDERPLNDIAPSWPVMRTNMINGIGKAKINPIDVQNFSAIDQGYRQWKKDPLNQSEKSTSGAKERATSKTGSDKPRTAAAPAVNPFAVEHEVAKDLSTEFKQAMSDVCKAAARCNSNQQAEIAALLRSLAADWTAKGQAYQAEHAAKVADAPTVSRRPAKPARESASAGAKAD